MTAMERLLQKFHDAGDNAESFTPFEQVILYTWFHGGKDTSAERAADDLESIFAFGEDDIVETPADVKLKDMTGAIDAHQVMSVQEFKEYVDDGSFIDYDGTGYYARDYMQSPFQAVPSTIFHEGLLKGWTHVHWYNR